MENTGNSCVMCSVNAIGGRGCITCRRRVGAAARQARTASPMNRRRPSSGPCAPQMTTPSRGTARASFSTRRQAHVRHTVFWDPCSKEEAFRNSYSIFLHMFEHENVSPMVSVLLQRYRNVKCGDFSRQAQLSNSGQFRSDNFALMVRYRPPYRITRHQTDHTPTLQQ